jgi:hypothetical protein
MPVDSYGLLFILLLIDYVILTLVDSPRWGGLLRGFPLAVTVLFAVHTSASSRRMVRVAQLAVVLSLAGGLAEAATGGKQEGALSYLLLTVLLMITPVVILRRVLPKQGVDIETLFAVVDVYIILGLIFSTLFIGIAHLEPAGKPFLAQSGYHPPSNYVYLSYVTLTTVGFGDLTPYSNVARSVVVFEALIGQIFLVTLVARLVALYSAESRSAGFKIVRKARHDAGDDQPSDATEDEQPELEVTFTPDEEDLPGGPDRGGGA